MSRIVFLHGLEAATDEQLIPTGGKARFLKARYGAATPGLNTQAARQSWIEARARGLPWRDPIPDYALAFATPMQSALGAIDATTQVVVGSSFGGAVLLRLLHESAWKGPSIFLASAGSKLTPYRSLPAGVPCLLIHGRSDETVPCTDSEALAATSPDAELWLVDDGHRLATILEQGTLERAIAWAEARLPEAGEAQAAS